MTIKVAVVGATGRMGKLALELIEAAQDLTLHAALDSKSELKQILGADLVFDVTRLDVSETVVDFAVANGISVVTGTSGWSATKLAQLEKKLADSANGSAVIVIPNFSIGSMLATKFAAEAAKYFDSIEIVESHHAGKVDSPSGTAIRTAELISAARLDQPLITGVGQPARGQVVAGIPVHSLRVKGVSAKQEVVLGGNAEVLSLVHEVSSIQAYEAGILLAIRSAPKASGLTVGLQALVEAE